MKHPQILVFTKSICLPENLPQWEMEKVSDINIVIIFLLIEYLNTLKIFLLFIFRYNVFKMFLLRTKYHWIFLINLFLLTEIFIILAFIALTRMFVYKFNILHFSLFYSSDLYSILSFLSYLSLIFFAPISLRFQLFLYYTVYIL